MFPWNGYPKKTIKIQWTEKVSKKRLLNSEWPRWRWKSGIIGKHCLCKADKQHVQEGGDGLANHSSPKYQTPEKRSFMEGGFQFSHNVWKMLYQNSCQSACVILNTWALEGCWKQENRIQERLPSHSSAGPQTWPALKKTLQECKTTLTSQKYHLRWR